MIDLALWAAAMVLTLLLLVGFTQVDPTGASRFAVGLLAGGSLLLLVIYHLAFATLWDGRTPGKALVGLRVRDAQGHPPRFAQLFLRSLFLPLELLPAPVPIGFAILASSARRQRLGDVVADTLVLRDPPSTAPTEPYARELDTGLWRRSLPLTPAVAARFDVEDRRILRALLTPRDLDPDSRRRLLTKAGRHYARVLDVPSPPGVHEAGELLRELYLYLHRRG